jgi:5-methylcytosine-specific restriction endonuclease McrA
MSEVILKECATHGLTEFAFRTSENAYRCRKCAAENVQRRRYLIKEKAVEYKGGKCEICGYDKCISALEFHHLNPAQKDFGIGQNGYSNKWEDIKKELDKCIMVCANCHREIHEKDKIELKNRIYNNKKMCQTTYGDFINQIVDMKEKQCLSYHEIAIKLQIARNTVMKYYKKYKNNS